MQYKSLCGIFILALLVALASGCISGGKPSQEAMDAANSSADRILTSFNSGSYADFSNNYSAPMLAALNESAYNGLRQTILAKYGNYTSRSSEPQVTMKPGYNVFVYDCKFEKNRLSLTVTMNATDIYKVEGLWYV